MAKRCCATMTIDPGGAKMPGSCWKHGARPGDRFSASMAIGACPIAFLRCDTCISAAGMQLLAQRLLDRGSAGSFHFFL